MRRLIGPVLFGLIGAAILVSLGIWQVQRLAWKEGELARIAARIGDVPVALPEAVDPARDRYLPVRASGTVLGEELHVLTSIKTVGPGYRVIAVFETAGRRVMLDRGFVAETEKDAARGPVAIEVTGNLHWPDEVDGFTPSPDLEANIWFARDVAPMAGALGTEPVLIVARQVDGAEIRAMPVDTVGIPNDHLEYAVTWFSLAVVWLGMTAFLIWRIRRQQK